MFKLRDLFLLFWLVLPVYAPAADECKALIDKADFDCENMGKIQPLKIDSRLKGKELTLFIIDYKLELIEKHLQELKKIAPGFCTNKDNNPTIKSMTMITQTKLETLRKDYLRWRERVAKDIPEPSPAPEPEVYAPGDFRTIVKSFALYPSREAKAHLQQYIGEVQAARERKDFDPGKFIDEKLIFNITGLLYAISKDSKVFEETKQEGIIATLFFPINKVTHDTLRQFVEFITGSDNKHLDELMAIVGKYDNTQKETLLNLFLNVLSNLEQAEGYKILLDKYQGLAEKEKKQIIEFFFKLILDYSDNTEFTMIIEKLAGMNMGKINQLIETISRIVKDSAIPDEQKQKLFFSYWNVLAGYQIKDIEQLNTLLDKAGSYNQLTGNAPLKLFLSILENYQPADIPLWKQLIATVGSMSAQERTLWTDFLPAFQMSNIRGLVTDVNLTKDKKEVSVLFEPFIFTGTTYDNLQNNMAINTQFQKLLAERYNLVYSTYDGPVFRIRGYFSQEKGKYLPAVEFWSEKNRLLIFAETLQINAVKGQIQEKELIGSYTAILQKFDQFLASLYIVAKNNPQLIAKTPQPEAIAAIIRSKIVIESAAENISAKAVLAEDKIAGVYFSDDLFWEKTGARDTEAEQLLGSDLRGKLVAYLNQNYLIDASNNYILPEPVEGAHYLKINLEFYKNPAEKRFSAHNEVDILFKKSNTLLLVNKVYFEKQLLAANKELVAAAVIERIAIELAAFFDLQKKPGAEQEDTAVEKPGTPQPGNDEVVIRLQDTPVEDSASNNQKEPDPAESRVAPKLQILSNFLMPGYTLQNNLGEDASLLGRIAITTWNYSNFALLGTAFASQIIFIGSGYDRDMQPLFYLSLGAAALYIINGTIGVLAGF